MSVAPAGTSDLVVAEGVWGEAFDELASEFSVRQLDPAATPTEVAAAAESARAFVVRNRTCVDRDLLRRCPALLLVGRAGVGIDNIDIEAANELGVVVSVPIGANAISVAEHTIGMALALSRHIVTLDQSTRSGQWTRVAGRELFGRRWSVLGLGATGRAVARLAAAFGMTVAAYDPYVNGDDPAVSDGIRLCSLEEAVRGADVLSIHLPSTAATRHLVDRRLLALLPDDAIIVNVARGDVVDETALAETLTTGRLLGAGLDVREVEPPAPGPIEARPDVILSPHVAGITEESQRRIVEILAADVRAVLTGDGARYALGRARPGRG